jgi:hypothetical protein
MILILLTLPSSTATPYWVKPGIYVEYAAKRYDPYIENQVSLGTRPDLITTASLLYIRNGTSYWIDCYNDTTIKFRVFRKENGYFIVGVVVDLKNVTIKFEVPRDGHVTPFWDSADVLSISRKVLSDGTVGVKVKLRSLRILEDYKIRERDGVVIGPDGTIYGHTFLWMENVSPNSTLVVLPQYHWNATVIGVSPENQKGLMTYYRIFDPPIVMVMAMGPPLVIPKRLEFSTNTPEGLMYDPSTELVLDIGSVGIAIVPDLAAISIPFATFTDEYYQFKIQHHKGGNVKYPTGLILYDTNAGFQRAQQEPFPKPKTPTEYCFYASIIFLGAVIARKEVKLRWRKEKESL